MNFLLVLSHLACFVGGAVMWNWIAKREGRALTGDEPEEPHHKNPGDNNLPRSAVYLLIAAVFLITIGVQQFMYQRQQDEADEGLARQAVVQKDLNECVAVWGDEVIAVLTARTEATSKLEAARLRRDDAVDTVLATVIALRAIPPEATDADFGRVLRDFSIAKNHLLRQQEKVDATREENPFPELNCSGGRLESVGTDAP